MLSALWRQSASSGTPWNDMPSGDAARLQIIPNVALVLIY